MAQQQHYSVFTGEIGEYRDTVIALLERNFDQQSSARFAWIYENYPKGTPRLYLLRHEESGQVVGMGTLFPGNTHLHGNPVTTYVPGDFVVDSEHRSFANARRLINAAIAQCQSRAPAVMLCIPNRNSGPVILRSGFKPLGGSRDMVKVLRSREYLQRTLPFAPLAWLLSHPLDLALQLRDLFHTRARAGTLHTDVLTELDERFDELLRQFPSHFALVGERSRHHLNWRIAQSPYGNNRLFVLFDSPGGQPLACLAFSRHKGRVNILDVIFDGDWRHCEALINRFIHYQKREGADSVAVSFVGSGRLFGLFHSLGFMDRGSSRQVMYLTCGVDTALPELIADGDWYLTGVDNDV